MCSADIWLSTKELGKLELNDGASWKVRRSSKLLQLIWWQNECLYQIPSTFLKICTCLFTKAILLFFCVSGILFWFSVFLCFFKHTFSLTFPFFSSVCRFPLKSNVEKMTPVSPNLSSISTSCMYIWQTQHGKSNSIWLRSKKCSLSLRTSTLLVAKGNYFSLSIKLSNHGDDSYNTSLSIQHPAGLSFSRMTVAEVTLNSNFYIVSSSGLLFTWAPAC